MIRTTPELVAEIVDVRPGQNLDPFISAASILVDRIEENTATPAEEILTTIETWLAAHFFCVYKPRRESERAGDVWATYMSKVGIGLDVTHYGQQAIMLDPTGTLEELNSRAPVKTRTVGVHWIGTEEEDNS